MHLGDMIAERTKELAGQLGNATRETSELLAQARYELITELSRTGEGIVGEINQTSATFTGSLAEQAQNARRRLKRCQPRPRKRCGSPPPASSASSRMSAP